MFERNIGYNDTVRDHFLHPRNVGELDDADGRGDVENPVCGDRTVLTIHVRAGRIRQAMFRTIGCPAAIAASSMTTELVMDKTLEQALAVTDADVDAALGGLPPIKMHCSVLAEDVIKAAIEDYRRRHH